MIEIEENGEQGGKEGRGPTLDHFIDKNSLWRRTEKKIITEPNPPLLDYIKPTFPIIKNEHIQEDETMMFTKGNSS